MLFTQGFGVRVGFLNKRLASVTMLMMMMMMLMMMMTMTMTMTMMMVVVKVSVLRGVMLFKLRVRAGDVTFLARQACRSQG